MLISRQVQASLDVSTIEELVVFASCNIGEVGHIGNDRSSAILAIEAEQCALSRKAVGCNVRLDGGLRPAQFFAILSIARVAKAGHPLMRMHL